MTAEMLDRLGVAALTGVEHLRAESLIPTYREAAGVIVGALDQNLVQDLAHRLFPDHPLAVHTAQIDGIGDVLHLLAGHRLRMEGDIQGTGAAVRHTVMNEKDLSPVMIRHAHLVPEDPVDAIRLSRHAVLRVLALLHDTAEDVTLLLHQCHAQGLGLGLALGPESRLTETVGDGHHLVNRKSLE